MTILEKINKTLIEAQLNWDSRIDAQDIHIQVDDGHVKLIGSVPTYLDRVIANNDVWQMPGVRSVRNDLIVKHPPGLTVPTDAEIETYLGHVLKWHPSIEASRIDVIVRNGHVELDGTISSYWHKLAVEEIATNTTGVINITNRLAVAPADDEADAATAVDIVDALRRTRHVDADAIDVMVKDGYVMLSGHVPDSAAYDAAQNAAAYTFGVIDVKNNLEIG